MKKTLGKEGVKGGNLTKGGPGMTANGSTNPTTGDIKLNPSRFAGDTMPAGLARTLYHEMRHVTQYAYGAAAAAGKASGPAANLGQACRRSSFGPDDKPLSGRANKEDIYERKKKSNPNQADRQMAKQQYKALAQEQDAFKVGDSTGD